MGLGWVLAHYLQLGWEQAAKFGKVADSPSTGDAPLRADRYGCRRRGE